MNEHTLQREGCPLHYWLGGAETRPLIVLTHGATGDHRQFDAQLPILSDKYSVLTWDMRGHGKSQPMGGDFTVPRAVDDLLAILDAVGVRQAVFVGQSTGGYVIQELVFRHPERVQALVMIDCTCITFPISSLEKWTLSLTPAILRLYPFSMLKQQFADGSSIRPDVRRYLHDAISQISKPDVIDIMTGVANCLHAEAGYHITQPMLLVHGDHDKLGNIAKIAPQWAAREANCQYIVIPDAGHMSNQDNPPFFNAVLLEFLAKTVQ